MSLKKQIPNSITLLNLFSGIVAVMLAVEGKLMLAGIFVLIGIFFDFFDGLVARLLNVQSDFGKQLDSLADMVTSGVVPGIILYQLLKNSIGIWNEESLLCTSFFIEGFSYIPLIGLLFSMAAAYRLANFNIDIRQTSSFVGLPTPAAALFVISLPFILNFTSIEWVKNLILNKWFLIVVTILLSCLMNSKLSLFALKLKDLSWKNNAIIYIFLLISIVLLITLKFVAVPIIIVLYILFSVIDTMRKK